MSARYRLLAVGVALVLLATALRFHRLEAQSFWNDEGNSARLSERSIPAILEGTASDIHPPLYYLLLRGWRELAGETEFGLRSLSAFAGVLTVAVTMALARVIDRRPLAAARRSGFRVAGAKFQGTNDQDFTPIGQRLPATRHWPLTTLFAGLFAAISPVLVYYSQETRMYALLALLAVGSTWALFLWLARREWRWAAAYVFLAAAGLYTHYFFPAVLATQGLVAMFYWEWGTDRRRTTNGKRRKMNGERPTANGDSPPAGIRPPSAARRPFVLWLLLAASAVVLYLPWMAIFLRQVGGRGGERAAVASFLSESGRWLALGGTVDAGEATWAVLAALALALVGAAFGGRRSAVPVLLIAVPVILMYLAGATDPAFLKFLLAAVPFVALLMSLAWSAPRPRLWLPGLLSVIVTGGMVVSLTNLYGDPAYARADYRGMAARIEADRGNVGVVLVAPNQWEVFTYYHRDGAPVYPLPLGRPDPALVEPELARIAADYDRLYALYWGDGQRDPERVVERWLDANTFKLSEEWVGDVRLAVYAVPRETAERPVASGAVFATLDSETITLQDYTVWPQTAPPGGVLQARLTWRADAAPQRPYKVFLHLIDADGRLVAQRDGEPAGGSRPTTSWEPGEPITDNYGLLLPADLPPGDYALRLGLYDALDPAARLPVEGGDSLLLATITVEQ